MRARAASARTASRESITTCAPCSAKSLAIASPIPMDAPVITATLPESSMRGLYPDGKHKSRRGVQSGNRHSKIVFDGEPLNTLLPLFPLDAVLMPRLPQTLHIFDAR